MATLTIRNSSCVIPPIKYGVLYNWYAATDVREITSSSDWVVPTFAQMYALQQYLGGETVAGGKLKETGFVYWNSPNTGATNEVGFNARGASLRSHIEGAFSSTLNNSTRYWNTDGYNVDQHFSFLLESSTDDFTYFAYSDNNNGFSIRLLKTSTTLSHGETGTYTDPSGFVYPTICIGTQEWVASNIKTQHYRDGTPIPEVTDNTTWAGLTTGALCAYNNDWNNV